MRNDTESNSVGCGVSFVGLLTAVFIVLKLTKVITWSWLWVFSPLWISWGLFIAALFILGILAIIVILREDRND